jgi:hypothetical protein
MSNISRRSCPGILPSVLLLAALVTPLLSQAQAETVLHSFDPRNFPDGSHPTAALVEDSNGALYGTTQLGGTGCSNFGCGVIFKLTPPVHGGSPWTESILYNLGSGPDDGTFPGDSANLIFDKNGNLYGTTTNGGTGNCNPNSSFKGCGTVFELSPPAVAGGAWTETTLYSFQGVQGKTSDGSVPEAGLVFDASGNLFGTTEFGGSGVECTGIVGACGTVFELSPSTASGGGWTEKIIHNFGDWLNDGANPIAPLVFAKSGQLLGTTRVGGRYTCDDAGSPNGCGAIFALIPPTAPGDNWIERSTSMGPQAVGAFISGGLVRGTDGKVYGVTLLGGSGPCQDALQNTVGCGVVFEITPPITSPHWGRLKIIYNFTGGSDGAIPLSSLLTDKTPSLYGVAAEGGAGSCLDKSGYIFDYASGCGTLFHLTPTSNDSSWSENTLYDFQGGSDGATPWSVMRNRRGGFFGLTLLGGSPCGSDGCGTAFVVEPVE